MLKFSRIEVVNETGFSLAGVELNGEKFASLLFASGQPTLAFKSNSDNLCQVHSIVEFSVRIATKIDQIIEDCRYYGLTDDQLNVVREHLKNLVVRERLKNLLDSEQS